MQKEKSELIEMFGVHFVALYNIPPLAARILGTLIVDCRQGVTFEGLVDQMKASKSSISTNLNLLLKLEKITYYTLPGDRRKYFRPAPFSDRLSKYIKMLDSEKQILDRLSAYREKTAACVAEQDNLATVKEYRRYLDELERLLLQTIDNFRQIEQKKHS